MCGIIGILGKGDVSGALLDGLKRLEYRGYDSTGIATLVNGRIASPTNPMPRFATEMIAVEIYASPGDVPDEYQRYVWGKQGRQTQSYRDHGGATSSDRCSLAVYWTSFS